MVSMGTLWFGDNINVLRDMADESIDLIYLDPPFNSNANYNILYSEPSGEKSQAQIQAFTDTWHWDTEAEISYRYLIENSKVPQKVSNLIKLLHDYLGSNDMSAYLVMMTIRLLELHRILKYTGSIYLHCDSTASHYLKIVMDNIFGLDNFINEIIWKRKFQSATITSNTRSFGNNHDIILFYTRSSKYKFNREVMTLEIDEHQYQHDEDGYYKTSPIGNYSQETIDSMLKEGVAYKTTTGKIRKKTYLIEKDGRIMNSVVVDNLWLDIPNMMHVPKNERLGYPTQKPLALLERIIGASSEVGDVVLDPFCGCGTAVDAAQGLGRRWIGIDISSLAIDLIKSRLTEKYSNINIDVKGVPTDLEGAKYLKEKNTKDFEYWALGLLGARPRTKDNGADGIIYFIDEFGKESIQVLVEIKSGATNVGMIRNFARTIEKEKKYGGIFFTLEEPSAGMRAEASSLGFSKSPNDVGHIFGNDPPIQKLQILTIKEFFDGKRPNLPYKNITLTRNINTGNTYFT